jgi:hypothetical protein
MLGLAYEGTQVFEPTLDVVRDAVEQVRHLTSSRWGVTRERIHASNSGGHA